MSGEHMQQLVSLPVSSDREQWSEDEAAAVEASGLVFKFTYGAREGEKVLAPRPVVHQFLHTVARTGLDPLARQIYCIGRQNSDGGVDWSIQTGIDGFRLIAEKSDHYDGQDGAEWLTAGGEWVDVWVRELHGERGDDGKPLPQSHPLAARVRVYRDDWPESRPAIGVATWEEYAQTKHNGDLTQMWRQRGPGQLAKCAEALAHRKAFPQDLSGIYTSDELGAQVLEVQESPAAAGAGRSRVAQLQARAAREAESAQEATEAPVLVRTAGGEVVPAEEAVEAESDGSVGFACSECGQLDALEEGGICGECELRIEEELMAAAQAEEAQLQEGAAQSEQLEIEGEQ